MEDHGSSVNFFFTIFIGAIVFFTVIMYNILSGFVPFSMDKLQKCSRFDGKSYHHIIKKGNNSYEIYLQRRYTRR